MSYNIKEFKRVREQLSTGKELNDVRNELVDVSIMSNFKHTCGSPSCIAGHFASVLDTAMSDNVMWKLAQLLAGIDDNEAFILFMPADEYDMELPIDDEYFITKDHVLAVLDDIIAGGKITEDIWVRNA